MKHTTRLATALAGALLLCAGTALAATLAPPRSVSVGFSPGNAEPLVVATINAAHRSILVAAYSFTSRPIANALLAAKARGVTVGIVADQSQQSARYTSIAYLASHGIPVRTDFHYAIMHNKFLVIDGATVETGSFNYTRAAQLRNAENVVVLHDDPSVAAAYTHEWDFLWGQSQPYQREAPTSGYGDSRYQRHAQHWSSHW